jgi:hypothetical protein
MESRQPPPINGGLNQQYPPKTAVHLASTFDVPDAVGNKFLWLKKERKLGAVVSELKPHRSQ